jgi:hypothetical protein
MIDETGIVTVTASDLDAALAPLPISEAAAVALAAMAERWIPTR